MTIRIAGTVNDSIVDGPGIRFTVFTQGCPHQCPGCHNPESHDPSGGREATVAQLMDKIKGNPLLDGVTLSGGEPFAQAEACAVIAEGAHELGLNVWTYTGYTYEYLQKNQQGNPGWQRLLDSTDVLVDGPFLQGEKSLELVFCGSRNQRLIDMKKTRESQSIVLWQRPEW